MLREKVFAIINPGKSKNINAQKKIATHGLSMMMGLSECENPKKLSSELYINLMMVFLYQK